ncbi:MAG: carboxypeptidase regulatory-like domain-containing protein [Planctomycetales bacterium]|nr:carboxypeptidase regulatory-like domain-containing protein [Planctomycetales bacterium]
MNRSQRIPPWLLLCAAALVVLGCNRAEQTDVSVIGTVTAAGAPLSGAVITLEPIAPTGGPNASVAVFDGRFRIGSDADLRGGRYRARVSMIPIEIRQSIPANAVQSMPSGDVVIDPRFDANSELVCELNVGQANRLDFSVDYLPIHQVKR